MKMRRMWPAGSRALPPAFPVGAGMGPFGKRAVHVRAEPSTEDSARPCPHSCGQHLSITRWRVMELSCPWAVPSPHLLQVSSASHCEKSRIHPQKFHSASPGRQMVPGTCRCIWTISLDTPCSPLDGTGPDTAGQGLSLSVCPRSGPRSSVLGSPTRLSGPTEPEAAAQHLAPQSPTQCPQVPLVLRDGQPC
uniref:Uncharacterized protein n=1 Tax=Myotis myotis TaxID=51298 RepID=A0A7J7ZXX6_MYOMY|nr:hypothetical protein mMyoMyo1_009986 [Myotis myotis]